MHDANYNRDVMEVRIHRPLWVKVAQWLAGAVIVAGLALGFVQ